MLAADTFACDGIECLQLKCVHLSHPHDCHLFLLYPCPHPLPHSHLQLLSLPAHQLHSDKVNVLCLYLAFLRKKNQTEEVYDVLPIRSGSTPGGKLYKYRHQCCRGNRHSQEKLCAWRMSLTVVRGVEPCSGGKETSHRLK